MNKDEIRSLLQKTSFVSFLSDEDLENLIPAFREENFKLGQTICKAGETSNSFYVIYTGKARIVGFDSEGKEATLSTISKGDHFGEQMLLTGEPGEFTVRASGNLVTLSLVRERFVEVLEKRPELKHYFEDYISDISLRSFIRQCTLFSPFNPQELRGFLDGFKSLTVNAGDYIVREGEEGDAFYLLRSGEVEVIKDSLGGGKVINRLKQGQFFGELALLTGAPRAASVRAVSEVNVYRLSKEDFDQIITSVPQVKTAVLGVAAGYSQSARQMLSEAGEQISAGSEAVAASAARSMPQDFAEMPQAEVVEEEVKEKLYVPRRKLRFPVLLQQSEMDCGAASLAMICRYFGLKVSINRLREMANVTREGATLHSLAEAAENLGFKTKGIRADYALLERSELPAIAHWEGYHYIVVYRVTASEVTVADPATGLKKIKKEDFLKGWNGILLLLTPTPDLHRVEPSQSTFARFLPFVTVHKALLFKVLIASLILQLLGLAIPLFMQNIVDKVLVRQDASLLNIMLAGMIVIAAFQVATSALRQYMLVFAARQIDMSLMTKFYSHVLGLPLKFFEDRKVGDIISRFNENSKIRDLLTGTSLSVVLDILTVIVYLSLMFYYNGKLALLALLFIPLFSILPLFFTPVMKKVSRESFQAGADTQSYIVESISGISTVKALAVEKPVRWKWEEKLQKMMGLQQKAAMIATAADSTSRILQTLSTTFILWYGANLVMAGNISVGQLMAFNALLGSVITPILQTIGLWDKIQEGRIALERLNDVLDAELEQNQGDNYLVMPPITGQITFKNVTFRYGKEDKNVLSNINLEIAPGQTVALVGRSGSGKTTLANLVLRMHRPVDGSILIDGIDIRNVAANSLRRQIGMVLQDNFLFSGTIKGNIALGVSDPPMEEVITAAMLAGANDFISELPMGYESVIGERGMSLSGGQRQRLAIARALFSRPRILILDEATSALDNESERIIQQNLDNILQDRTTIVIAHRLSTVRNADLIVVLDKGVIMEKGTHYELMEKKGLYFYLNSQQLQG
ncbi:peptidase domain-containing ABC transporter [Candidatus Micrarchaeota archaeon]|nr:peptidase domain-containing ABC transporter [Candidatus Micrarchaeota archaeon]